MINFELNGTYRCNASCFACNRLIDLFRIPNSDLTLEQAREALTRLKADGFRIAKLKISGGEAMLNPQLDEIIKACLDSGIVGTIWVLSNGIKERHTLPRGARWQVDPIVTDPKDGWKYHQPFLISPDDLGLRSESCGVKCATAKVCGHAFEAFGFTFCGVAGALGHLLKINPYTDRPTTTLDERICKHCIYSLPLQQQQELQPLCPPGGHWPDGTGFGNSTIDYPTKTFQAALKTYRKNPTRFPRMFDDQPLPSTQKPAS